MDESHLDIVTGILIKSWTTCMIEHLVRILVPNKVMALQAMLIKVGAFKQIWLYAAIPALAYYITTRENHSIN